MKKTLFTENLNGRQADLDQLHKRILSEIEAMSYNIHSEVSDDGFILDISKDISGIDLFLGRWQRSRIKIYCNNDAVQMNVIGRDRIDKIICAVIGPLFLAIPWIFGLIASSNRRNIELIIHKLVEDYATKIRLSE